MKGILALVFVCLIADFTDAQVTSWTQGGFTVSAGTGTPIVTMKYDTKVVETSTANGPIVTLTPLPDATYTFAFTATGNPGSVAQIAALSGKAAAIQVDTGKSIDYETTKSLVFVITATPTSGTVGTATVTVEIKNMVEFSGTHYVACLADKAAAGTTVGTYTPADKASDDTITYTIAPATHFAIGATTGVVTVKTGVTLDKTTLGGDELTVTATPGATGSSANTAATTKLWVAIGTCSSSALQVTAMLGMVMLSFATALFL